MLLIADNLKATI
uniref:Uncharacterized protein n=1 Tax=Arundo donax TaxID=35708 RepID=A0A0A9AUN6_ARUDO